MEIIDSYDKLPLGMYMDIIDVCDDKDLADDDKQMEIISILSGKSVDELMRMNIMDFRRYAAATAFLEQPCSPKKAVAREYKCGGMTFTVNTDVTKMTTAQYVDFQQFSEMGRSKLPEMLSCFFIPKGRHYNEDYDVAEVQSVLRENLTVTEAMALYAFFLKRWIHSVQTMLIYSALMLRRTRRGKEEKRKMRERIRQQWTLLRRNGDG